MTEVYRVIIPGSPGPAKVNTRTTALAGKGKAARVVLSSDYRQWRGLAVALMRDAAVRFGWPATKSIRTGSLAVTVDAFWPRKHAKGEAEGLALGDVDAVAKACLDALEHAGVIGDDAQVVELVCRKAHDKSNPRIEIEVRRHDG